MVKILFRLFSFTLDLFSLMLCIFGTTIGVGFQAFLPIPFTTHFFSLYIYIYIYIYVRVCVVFVRVCRCVCVCLCRCVCVCV